MDDPQAAKIGPRKNQNYQLDPKVGEFWKGIGEVLVEMRKKRSKSQKEFSIPVRTVRRIEKGKEPHVNALAYGREMKPCLKEMAKVVRLLEHAMEPECRRCDPDCQMYGRNYREFVNAVRTVIGLPES